MILRVEMVHHKTVNRAKLIKEFKEGNIDILIGSMIVKRGKNFPLMKAMIHAGGGDSEADILQLFGRATRTHKDKQYTFFEDFFDEGNYLKRHSKHRLMAFKRENLEVIEKYKM
jgi:superfamily II DNA or RNA helicase